MSTLVLKLAAPMQSWGMTARFTRRTTQLHPTKSGVLGLLAAAEGRRRTDPIEDLVRLRFGVRIDQPGHVERDFQTARSADGQALPLSHRYYLADAVFVAAVEGDDTLIGALHDAVRRPVFPLYLGRRAFPPAGPLQVAVRPDRLHEVLRTHPWQASPMICRRAGEQVVLDLILDADTVDAPDQADLPGLVSAATASDDVDDDPANLPGAGIDFTPDLPVSFDPARRQYVVRRVIHARVRVPNPRCRVLVRPGVAPGPGAVGGHDPMDLLGE